MKKIKGVSFIEAIVALAIFSLGLQAFSMLFIKTWQSNSFIIEEGQASSQASKAVNEAVQNLRNVQQPDNGSYPIESADDDSLVVYSDIDNDGIVERVHYFLDGDAFKVGTSESSGTPPTYPTSDQSVRTLATDVASTSEQPVFYYYNANYPGDPDNNPLSTPASVSDVRLIGIHLFINIDPVKAPNNINIESIAELRNLNDYVSY